MPLYLDSFKNNPPEGFNNNLRLEGLESFRRSLEKFFFSEVTIRTCMSNSTKVELAIELNCNLSLVEVLFHFNKGTWGNFTQGKSSFTKQLQKVKDENNRGVDIKEFCILFKDITIVINKIYSNSIPEQLSSIFKEMGKHYVHFSKGLTEIPYEIYIPVFEECNNEKDVLLRNIETGNHTKKDYFQYWGLYFDSEDDAVIYDLKEAQIKNGDLFMLND